MKLVILAACIGILLVLGAPQRDPPKILKYGIDHFNGSGNYSFAFTSEDGIEREEHGLFLYPDTENETYVIIGSFSYTGPDGVLYKVTYQADGGGFHPDGEHIPPELPKSK